MRPSPPRLRLLAALAVLGLLLAERTGAQICPATTPAAPRGLLSSFIDTALNVPKGEDTEFFTRTAGVPNIFFLIDTSASMLRLAPNGPASFPGTRPPLQDVNTAPALPAFNDDCTDPTGQTCAVIGCGEDPVSTQYAGSGSLIAWLRARTYAPPCGDAVNPALVVGQPYQQYYPGTTTPVSYASESSRCPHWIAQSGGADPHQQTGDPGYDPDFYCGSSGNTTGCSGNRPNLFDGLRVYHDTLAAGPPSGWPGDGWSDRAVTSSGGGGSVPFDDFCKGLYGNTARQGGALKKDICSQCLSKRGFVLDGRMFRQNQDGGSASPATPVPSIYYSGNFLNFYPPKFVVARKVTKDVIMTLSKVRAAIGRFGATGLEGAPNQFQGFNPQCDQPDSSFDANRTTYLNLLNGFTFGSGKPLARSLLDVGYYYHSTDLPWWTSTYAGPFGGQPNATQASICYACQVSSVVVVTDGIPWSSESAALPPGATTAGQVNALYAGDPSTGIVPAASGGTSIDGALCPRCGDFTAANDWKNDPTRVAWYLHNLDLRRNDETTLDCDKNGGKQTLNVYGVGFAANAVPDAGTVLGNMAAMGGGVYVSADTPGALKQGLLTVVDDINTRSTSFSVATVSTLQTTAGHSVIIPRFDPSKGARWKGHLYRHELYSEFLNPCTETSDGSGSGDLDCDGRCDSVFLMDRDGDFIQEDADGILRKNDPPTAVPCSQAPRCAALGRCAVPGTAVAEAWWDAQAPLSASTWRSRKVFTVVDRDAGGASDGRVDARDVVFQLDTSDATAERIAPYMPLGDGAVCQAIAARVEGAGDLLTGQQLRTSQRFCVKTIVRYLLGADVFNEKGAALADWRRDATDDGQDTLPDRDYKLGDIFHSSPVVVDPPPPPDGVLCPNGLHNQCLTSLWQTPVPSDPPGTNAYGAYAKSTEYQNRRKVVVVGANDGMLHAFDGGTWHAGARDPFIWEKTQHQVDTALPPFNGYYDRGTGEELWAFVPPDMLAKLHLLAATTHHLYVDGSPMVRDVWVDGSTNGLPGATSRRDGKKQAWEFHTVGIFAERRGGTHYFALDLTDATRLPYVTGSGGTRPANADFVAPRFLWIHPQPDARATLGSGETYNDYLPVGPPIGPVRLETGDAGAPTVTVPDPTSLTGGTVSVPYEERWVAMLSGGFDPQYLRGRGVHMVDAWTGEVIWDFAYPERSLVSADDPRRQLKAPIPATVGMVMWGSGERRRRAFENDGYFDTATFGDTAGQLWVLRFGAPGKRGSTGGPVTNWLGARIMEMPGCANQPFWYVTANVPVSGGIYRVLAGTGDRFNLLDTHGGVCGPDNIRACVQRGCTVTIDGDSNLLATPELGARKMSLAAGASCSGTSTSDLASASACTVLGRARISVTACPSPSPVTGPTSTTKDFRVTCTQTSTGLACQHDATPLPGAQLALSNTSNAITQPNWFFSLRVFDDEGARRIFWTPLQAAVYDANRRLVSSPTTMTAGIVPINGAQDAPTTLATSASAGWAMYYQHDGTVTVGDHSYPVDKLDERTSSTSAVYGGIFWNTTQPAVGSSSRQNTSGKCPNVAICTMESRRISYHYGADPTTGGPVLRDLQGNAVRALKNTTLVPTMGDQPTVFVNQKGQVQVGLTAVNPEKGATNIDQGATLDPAPAYGLIEVGRGTHACRHAPDGAPPDGCGK